MTTAAIADGRSSLYQYDTGRRLILTGVEAGTEIHFATLPDAETPIPMVAYQEGEQVLVDVPDELLARSISVLLIWIYEVDDTGQLTRTSRTLPVISRPEPPGYVSDPTKAKTWAELEQRIADLERRLTTANIRTVCGSSSLIQAEKTEE